MKKIANVYLGNLNRDRILAQKIASARKNNRLLEVTLQESDRSKGRILARSTNGVVIGIARDRESKLQAGDVFQTTRGDLVLIHLQLETLMVLTLDEVVDFQSAMEFVRLGHLLGNQHYPIKIEGHKIYVRPISDRSVLTQMIEKLNLSGLTITWEQTAAMQDIKFRHHH